MYDTDAWMGPPRRSWHQGLRALGQSKRFAVVPLAQCFQRVKSFKLPSSLVHGISTRMGEVAMHWLAVVQPPA
jgi:hypothetical protein